MIESRNELIEFIDSFFNRYPCIKISDTDEIAITHDLFAFGLDCIALGQKEQQQGKIIR